MIIHVRIVTNFFKCPFYALVGGEAGKLYPFYEINLVLTLINIVKKAAI